MINDPIVEEIHRTREKLFAECDGDMKKYLDRLREAQKQHPERVITKDQMPPRKPAL